MTMPFENTLGRMKLVVEFKILPVRVWIGLRMLGHSERKEGT